VSKKKIVFLTVGDYPASWWQTPEEVKAYMYDLQYQLLRKEEPFKWENPMNGKVFEDEPWEEDDLRSLAAGLVQAKLGWGKPGFTLRVSKKDAEKIKEAKQSAKKKLSGETPESMAPGYVRDVTPVEEEAEEIQRRERIACTWHEEGGYGHVWDCPACKTMNDTSDEDAVEILGEDAQPPQPIGTRISLDGGKTFQPKDDHDD
jgi:hypothetical protein